MRLLAFFLWFVTLATGGALAIDRLSAQTLVEINDQERERVQGFRAFPSSADFTYLKSNAASHFDIWRYSANRQTTAIFIRGEDIWQAFQSRLDGQEKQALNHWRQAFWGSLKAYRWSPNGKALVFVVRGDVFVYDHDMAVVIRVSQTPSDEEYATFSPSGRLVSFIRNARLFVYDLESGTEKQLIKDRDADNLIGVPERLAAEEFRRFHGYWWSPDGGAIAVTRFSLAKIARQVIKDVTNDGYLTQRSIDYPLPSQPVYQVDLGIYQLATGRLKWIHRAKSIKSSPYVTRVQWERGGASLSYELLSRDHQELRLMEYDRIRKKQRTLRVEKSDVWINLHKMQYRLPDGRRIWASESSGFMHLYLLDSNGRVIKPLTSGHWPVTGLAGVDAKNGYIYFSALKDGPTNQHLYSVSIDGGVQSIARLTKGDGWHVMKVYGGYFMDKKSTISAPPSYTIHDLSNGQRLAWVSKNALDSKHRYTSYLLNRSKVQLGEFTGHEGQQLYYKMVLPPDFDPLERYPLILAPYGGPQAQRVRNRWSLNLNELLAREGYIVLVVDGRGMAGRGLAFEKPLKGQLGRVEIADQIAALNWASKLPYVDAARVGIKGWSYGGYVASMIMAKHADRFKAGVAIAPVTDWRHYNAIYGERFIGSRKRNQLGYENSSLFSHLSGMQGPFLLAHGMADEEVLYSHSWGLAHALLDKDIDFTFLSYPRKGHRLYGARAHLYDQVLSFFNRHLR